MCRKKMVPVGDLYERVHNSRKNGQSKNYELIAKLCRTKINNVKRWFNTGSIPEYAYILIERWNNREIRISNIDLDKAINGDEPTWHWVNKPEDNLPLLETCDNSAIDGSIDELTNPEDHELKSITKAKFFIENAFVLPNSGVTLEAGTRDAFINALKEILINGGD